MGTVEALIAELEALESRQVEGEVGLDRAVADAREALAAAYIRRSERPRHLSSCATSRAPACTPGPCDCPQQLQAMAPDRRKRYEPLFPDLFGYPQA